MGPSGVASTVPIAGGSVQPSMMAPTIPVDAPTRQETKEAFDEVSSAFKEMSEKHWQIQGGLQVLASMVEALQLAKQGELETTTQVQQTLHHMASTTSALEVHLGATSTTQEQLKATMERA